MNELFTNFIQNVEELSEALTIDVIEGRIGARQSLMLRTGILSIPGALLEGMVIKMS